jgi:hypothetical protein
MGALDVDSWWVGCGVYSYENAGRRKARNECLRWKSIDAVTSSRQEAR